MILYGYNTKYGKLTGWVPETAFGKALKDLLDYWRNRV